MKSKIFYLALTLALVSLITSALADGEIFRRDAIGEIVHQEAMEYANVTNVSNGGLETDIVHENDINYGYIELLKQRELEELEKRGYIGPYGFEEPPNFANIIPRHMAILAHCPEPLTASGIWSILTKMDMADRFDEADVEDMLRQCETQCDFRLEPEPLPPSIASCVESLVGLLSSNNISMEGNNYLDLYRECYIRDYFDERYDEDTFEGYNASLVSEIYDRRDTEFVDFRRYKTQYPDPVELVDEGGPRPLKKDTNDTREREVATNNYEPAKPTQNLLEMIFTKIRNFLRWFT